MSAEQTDAEAVRRESERVMHLSEQHELPTFLALGSMSRGWSRARLGKTESGNAELRDGLTAYIRQGTKAFVPFYQGLLAEIEAESHGEEAVRRLDEALALAQETGEHGTDAFLHRIRGEILFKSDPANIAPAEEAYLTAIAVAQQQKAKSFELQAALALAKLYRSANRGADAHAVLAPALEGFSPTPEFPEIAETQALLAALAESKEVKNATASRQRRLKLQTSYAQALSWGKGYATPETAAAFARARDFAASSDNPGERFATLYGQWSVCLLRADLTLARQLSDALLVDAEKEATLPEIAVGHRTVALTRFLQGAFKEAQTHSDEALRIYDPQWDRDAKFRTNHDTGATATMYSALASWILGDANRARKLADEAISRALDCNHVPTATTTGFFKALFEAISNRADTAGRDAQTLITLAREHETPTFLAFAIILHGWARARLGERDAGVAELNDGLTDYVRQRNRTFLPLLWGLLSEIEAEGARAEGALTRVDEALALAGETGERWSDALLHRIRAEILFKCDPVNTAPAEEAFLTAIAVAQQQKAKSFELRAALSLAKLYQSTGRAADAHDVLAPALEGFSPTPEFPEIAEAQALLDTLGETDEVKTAAAARQRRLKLQTSYGQAVMWSKGYAAPETAAAFARAQELSVGTDNSAERFVAYFAKWAVGMVRAELASARETAQTFVREAEREGRGTERVVGLRILGLTSLQQGDFIEARAHFEEALRTYDPERDQEAKFRYGQDAVAGAFTYLAFTSWALGEVGATLAQTEEGLARALGSNHPSRLTSISSRRPSE